ncbi:hypothetical protein GCM10009037_05600 [Halarchaeum grantii]|uniref:Uncharacterized protein n=1 Tax=Halarchaeum grantii TaxID=1193105 RepID=A0A830EZD4_9EURY|nr:hypothetical protein [Halarchaeum grantii]GGL24933.1 hypothetical protein GCM10009037_05600 [Halarchaeum grantii]
MPDSSANRRLPGFFYRFAHPALAVVSTVGAVLWLAGFGLAGAGVGLRASDPTFAYRLFAWSGVVTFVGVALIVAVVAYLVGLWLLRDVLGVLDREKPEPGARR